MAFSGTAGTTLSDSREYTNLEKALYSKLFMRDLALWLGSEEAAATLAAAVFNQAREVPALHECTIESIRLNVGKVAALHLNPALPNMVSFISRNAKRTEQGREIWVKELTIQYGYAGLRTLIMRSPEVKDCWTHEVCANDQYESPRSITSPPFHQLPSRFAPRGRVEGYYAVIELQNGNWRHLQMSVAEIEGHVARYCLDSHGNPGKAWGGKAKRPDADGLTTYDKQALKTVLRMLCNARDLPMTAEVALALEAEASEERVPIAAESQGYNRYGQRPALTMSTGVSLDELLQDTYGVADKVAIEAHLRGGTRPSREDTTPAPPVLQSDHIPQDWRTALHTLATATLARLNEAHPKALAQRVRAVTTKALDLAADAEASQVQGEACLEVLRTVADELSAQPPTPQEETKSVTPSFRAEFPKGLH